MKLARWLADLATSAVVRALRLNRANRFTCMVLEKAAPVYRIRDAQHEYLFHCPNILTRWRAHTLFTKEPDTIAWINGFEPGSVLYDIGANVGIYTIYAARRGIRVFAFEPESQNYAILNRNVYLNGLSDRVTCLNVALADRTCLDYLYLPQFRYGSSLNGFGEARDWQNKTFAPEFKQGALSFSLDSFLAAYALPFPTHIKLDVDGLEAKIVQGARQTLADPRLRSALMELNEKLPEDRAVLEMLPTLGLSLKQSQRINWVTTEDAGGLGNHVFCREDERVAPARPLTPGVTIG